MLKETCVKKKKKSFYLINSFVFVFDEPFQNDREFQDTVKTKSCPNAAEPFSTNGVTEFHKL